MAGQLAASTRRFLLIAPGSGRGHATRMGALCAELNQLGHTVRLLLRPEARAVAVAVGAPSECVMNTPALMALEHAWAEFRPTDVVVDTFPEQLATTVLRDWPKTRSVALLRYRRDSQAAHFVKALAAYDLVYDLEPVLTWAPPMARPFGAVVRRLAAAVPNPCCPKRVLLVKTEPRHAEFLRRLAGRLEQHQIEVAVSAPPGVSRYAAPLLSAEALSPRVVVGPAGYNLTYELLRGRVWHLALPVAREYDDQRLRGRRLAAVVTSPAAAERRVLAWLEQPSLRPAGSVRTMSELARELQDPA